MAEIRDRKRLNSVSPARPGPSRIPDRLVFRDDDLGTVAVLAMKGQTALMARSRELEPFGDPAVAEVFGGFEGDVRERLLELRQMVFEAARRARVGPVREALKWGQPSYVPAAPRTGSPLRLGTVDGAPAMFFHCQTTLVASFRDRHGEALHFEGNRAVVVAPGGRLPRRILLDCMVSALTYHQRTGG